MHINLEEAKEKFFFLIQQAMEGKEIIITEKDKPLVKLTSISKPQFGSARGLISMSDDFDAPLEDFKEYME